MFRLFDNKKQGNLIIYKVSHTFNHCGRWDLNPHVVSDTRSLVLPVCQFQHFRIHCMKQNCAFHSLRVCKLYDSTAARSCQQNFVKYLKFLQLFQLIIFLLLFTADFDNQTIFYIAHPLRCAINLHKNIGLIL